MPQLRNLRDLEKAVWNTLDRAEGAFRNRLRENYREALDSIRAEMSKTYEKYATEGKLTKAQMTKYNRLAKLEKRINDILGEAHNKNTRLFKRLREDQYAGSFFRHQWAIEQNAGAALSWGTFSEDAIEKAAMSNYDLVELANSDLKNRGKNRLRRTITQGLIRGDSYEKMARRLKGEINKNATEAMRIVRTEGQKAAVWGQQESYKRAKEQAGVEMTEVWDATLDGRTRPEHGRMDGKKAEMRNGEPMFYSPSVGWIRGPLQSGVPSFDINCRCRVRGEVAGYPPKVRRVRDEGLKDYQTFEQWARERGITKNKYGQRLV